MIHKRNIYLHTGIEKILKKKNQQSNVIINKSNLYTPIIRQILVLNNGEDYKFLKNRREFIFRDIVEHVEFKLPH